MSSDSIGNNPGAIAEGRSSSLFAEAALGAINRGGTSVFTRVVVEEVIFDPSLIDDDRVSYYQQQFKLDNVTFLKDLPPNTIIGRPVLDGTTSGAEQSQYFFPMFPPHMMFPIKAGEHVWVFYEAGKDNRFGYWMFRINEPRNVDDLNYTHHDRLHDATQPAGARDKAEQKVTPPGFPNGPTRLNAGKAEQDATGASYPGGEKAYEDLISKSDSGKVHDFEDVPRFKKRPGDLAFQGSNNSLIVLGTDRTGAATESSSDPVKGKISKGKPTADKKGKAGSIDLVVGRGQGDKTKPKKIDTNTLQNKEINKDTNLSKENPNEGDPDFETDLGRVYVSMKTDPDKNFNVKLKGIDPTDVGDGASAGVIKCDHVRIIARKTIKFLVQPKFDSPESDCAGIIIKDNGEIVFVPSSAGIVKLGGDDADKCVLCFDVPGAGANAGGTVASPPMMSTMGGFLGLGGAHGVFATKIMAK